jgi:hypothetical protein
VLTRWKPVFSATRREARLSMAALAGGCPVGHLSCPIRLHAQFAAANEPSGCCLASGEGPCRPAGCPLVCPAAKGIPDAGLGRRSRPPAEAACGFFVFTGEVVVDVVVGVCVQDDHAVSQDRNHAGHLSACRMG